MEHQPITNQSFKMIREGNFSLNHILLEKILSPTMNSSSMNHNLKTEILIKDTTKVDKDRDIVNDHSMIERMRGEVIRIIKNRKKEKQKRKKEIRPARHWKGRKHTLTHKDTCVHVRICVPFAVACHLSTAI